VNTEVTQAVSNTSRQGRIGDDWGDHHRRVQGGLRGLKHFPKFFQILSLIDGSRHRNVYWGDFLVKPLNKLFLAQW